MLLLPLVAKSKVGEARAEPLVSLIKRVMGPSYAVEESWVLEIRVKLVTPPALRTGGTSASTTSVMTAGEGRYGGDGSLNSGRGRYGGDGSLNSGRGEVWG